MNRTAPASQSLGRLAVLACVVGFVVVSPAIADFSIDFFSPSIAIPTTPHAPDDLLTSGPAFGGPFLPEDAGGPGPAVTVPSLILGFGGLEVDALSWDPWSFTAPPGLLLAVYFSVDRFAVGLPGGAVFREAAIGEAAGDVFEGVTYLYPVIPPPFPQPLPFGGPPSRLPFGPGKNNWAPPVLACPLAAAAPPPEAGGDHRMMSLVPTPPGPAPAIDDLDALDCYNPALAAYTSLTAATGLPLPAGFSSADILVSLVVPGFAPYAPAPTMGLDAFGFATDDIDALVVFDMDGDLRRGLPGVDFALFSLRAGSPTLAFTGLSPSDVFVTDFTGGFDIFAYGTELGLAIGDELDAVTLGFPTPARKCVDQDGDGDVDLSDFAVFVSCFAGSFSPPAATCPPGANTDFDNDGDVDLADFAILTGCFGGSGNPVPAGCPLGC